MISSQIVFIGSNEYDNLGIGYISAVLEENGFRIKVIDILSNMTDTSRIIKEMNPQIVGFSIIYHYYLNNFRELINFLREDGINCHFTAGGHYASLQHKELFRLIPTLDSIVRFEGEYTMLELAKSISHGIEWRHICGVVYKSDNKIVENPLRPFEKDLDRFPFPLRSPLKEFAFWKNFATIIAGRGCIHKCSFCNTRKFYSQSAYSIKRVRRPEMVISEMEQLYHKEKCEIFLFLDDDFPVKPVCGKDWIAEFCSELERADLSGKIMWKINCRPDEVDEERFAFMKRHGLFSVFLGIEDGTNSGLKKMNKKLTVESCLNAVAVLNKLKLRMDYGFMLFHPYTTFSTLNGNLDFLGRICGDGYTPVTFLKMIPFYGTQIESELFRAGRLKVNDDTYGYDFPDLSMDRYYSYIMDCFIEWLRASDGMENTARWVADYIAVYKYFFKVDPYARTKILKIRKIISESNLFLLEVMKDMSKFFENNRYEHDRDSFMERYKNSVKEHHQYFKTSITSVMAELISHGQNYIISQYIRSLRHVT